MSGNWGFKRNKLLIERVRGMLTDARLPRSLIISGEVGADKLGLARAIAKALLCENSNAEPCGQCVSCKTFDSGNNPDLYTLGVEKGKRDIKVEHVRSVIDEGMTTKPMQSDNKVVIIEQADRLNQSGQNALLKIIEEPPSFAYFIFVSDNDDNILQTIWSRSTRLFVQGGEETLSDEQKHMRDTVFEVLAKTQNERKGDLLFAFEAFKVLDPFRQNVTDLLDCMLLYYRNAWARDVVNAGYYGFCVDTIIDAQKNVPINANFQMTIENLLLRVLGY